MTPQQKGFYLFLFVLYLCRSTGGVETVSPTVVAVTIVKNEGRIIERFVRNIGNFVDYFVMCDTGSTDNTTRVLEVLSKDPELPPIHIFNHTWIDYGHNRQECTNTALSLIGDNETLLKGTYLMMLDADYTLWVPPESSYYHLAKTKKLKSAWKADLRGSEVALWSITESYSYRLRRIWRADVKCTWKLKVDEYLDCPKDDYYSLTEIPQTSLWIYDFKDGGNRKTKYDREMGLAKKGLLNDPSNSRYMFYIAQRLYDKAEQENNQTKYMMAANAYHRRIEAGGDYHEEIYYSKYRRAKALYFGASGTAANVSGWFLDAWEYRPSRIESIYMLANINRAEGNWNQCIMLTDVARKTQLPKNDTLFVETNLYTWTSDDLYALCVYHGKNDATQAIAAWKRALSKCPESEKFRIHNNLMRIISSPATQKGIIASVFYCLRSSLDRLFRYLIELTM